ncbi:MAG TPA: alcohol dehydrogenase catalytic domain-containing protein [Propionibacteriaceae bacterium]|nr:alcohol dehydrogenase catalytic domain-containing protein [Propionibacteriaceae bacterium]
MPAMYANELDVPAPLSERPLQWRQAPKPEPAEGQLLIEVAGCGVCRSNLHMIEGEWVDSGVPAISPIIPGHEVTGRVAEVGVGVTDFAVAIRSVYSRCGGHARSVNFAAADVNIYAMSARSPASTWTAATPST